MQKGDELEGWGIRKEDGEWMGGKEKRIKELQIYYICFMNFMKHHH